MVASLARATAISNRLVGPLNSLETQAQLDCQTRRVRTRFRKILREGAQVRATGLARTDPAALLERYMPVCAVDLFQVTYFLSGYLYDEALGFFVGFLVVHDPGGGPVTEVYPRIFYKDSSLMWRVASHYVHDAHEYWIGKGDVRRYKVGDDEYVCSVEETTNLPFEVQSAFDEASRARPRKRDDDAVELVLRRAPSGRIKPYADFTAPRRKNTVRINGGRPVVRFTREGDPKTIRFTKGYEPDLEAGVAGESEAHSDFFGGRLRKFRVLSTNRKIQYMFFASPTHAWVNPPQALTRDLSTYGVRLVDVEAHDDLFVPGYEYHEEDEDGVVTHSQIPDGYVGNPHPDDPHRSDASAWLEALPVIQEFRKRLL